MAETTMSQLAIAPPTQADDSAAIDESYAKLQELLGGMQGVDFDKAFAPYMEHIKKVPLPRRPGRAEAFARSFSSEEGAKSVMSEIAQHREASKEREASLLETEREILKAKVQQEMQKGNASQALKTQQELKKLESHLSESTRLRTMEDWTKKQELLFGKKQELETHKSGLASQRIQDKAKAIADNFNLDAKATLKLMDYAMKVVLARVKSKLTFDPMMGPTLTDEETEMVQSEAIQALTKFAEGLGQAPIKPTGTTPGRSRLREIANKKKEERK